MIDESKENKNANHNIDDLYNIWLWRRDSN
jgi:hypothetical protein